MRLTRTILMCLFGLAIIAAAPVRAEIRVLASIAPLHSIAEAVAGGQATVDLLIPPNASPHTYALKPSDMRNLADADLLVWVGPSLETFLPDLIASSGTNAESLPVIDVPNLTVHPYREAGIDGQGSDHSHDDHGPGHSDHDHSHDTGEPDPHIWLDPENAKLIATVIAERLSIKDPEHAEFYLANAQAFIAQTELAMIEIDERLSTVRDRPFLVFHDSIQYFEKAFRLSGKGAITVNPEQPMGARRLGTIRTFIRDGGAVCVFSEPQFSKRSIEALTADTGARIEELDPLGATLQTGQELYLGLIRKMASTIVSCLS